MDAKNTALHKTRWKSFDNIPTETSLKTPNYNQHKDQVSTQ